MQHQFIPFTQEQFRKETGLIAEEHEGIYLRWVNAHINYQNFLSMKQMNLALEQIIELLSHGENALGKAGDD